MTADFRALCVELVNELHGYKVAHSNHDTDLIDRARAALAEPEPEVPSDQELLAALDKATADFPPLHPEAEALNAVEYPLALELRKARAVLARWGTPNLAENRRSLKNAWAAHQSAIDVKPED